MYAKTLNDKHVKKNIHTFNKSSIFNVKLYNLSFLYFVLIVFYALDP